MVTRVDPPLPRSTPQPISSVRGKRIGRFELIRELGQGGMGQVFLARDAKLGRKVAIKIVLRDDPTFVRRFVAEARATARCMHDNIVTIYEAGEHEGLPFMVLEYLEGKALGQLLAKKLPVRPFTEIIVAVVRALDKAHEHGIVHRDLKPSNIFVTDQGKVKVLDFGLARVTSGNESSQVAPLPVPSGPQLDQDHLTHHGTLVGTFPYMSPEQWLNIGVDPRTDLWAVGIMFWRAFATMHPAGSTEPNDLRARLTDLANPLPSLGEHAPAVPAALVAIVDRCLALAKEQRYQSASELLDDLQRFLAPRARGANQPPYRGLAAYGADDADYFFGRSNEIRMAVTQLDSWPVLAVVGPSGVGKSSFVHAGVIPALREAAEIKVLTIRPGREPLHRLAALVGIGPRLITDVGQIDSSLADRLRDEPGVFGELLRRDAVRTKQNVVVVVDQLEELFTHSRDPAIHGAFLAALFAAADDPMSPIRVVMAMRADFLDRLGSFKAFLDEVARGLFFLAAPTRENLRETLERPAELAGYAFESAEIVEDMLQAGTSQSALALVSFAALELWDARDVRQRLLTLDAYRAMGGVGGAFARHADRVLASIPAESRSLFHAIMSRLVTTEGTRAIVDHRELLSLAPDGVERIVDQLVRARLVQLNRDEDEVTVELVHEMLITEWPALQAILEAGHGMRGFVEELRLAARQWIARGRPADLVWRGKVADEALLLAHRNALDLAAGEREYLEAMTAERARTRRFKRTARIAGATIAIVVLALGAAAVVRITAAEHAAQNQAAAAKAEALDAETARRQVARELEVLKTEQAAREQAETEQRRSEEKLLDANAEIEASRQQLEDANAQLKRALIKARIANASARAANQKLETALAKERERIEELERDQAKIYAKELK